MKMAKPLLVLIGLALVLGCAYAGYSLFSANRTEDEVARTQAQDEQPAETGRSEEAGPAAGDAAQAQLLADHDAMVYTDTDEAITLTGIADGSPLVINFWATWCPYCVQELPDFQDIYHEYGDRVAFAFIDAADGSRETVSGTVAWLAENGYDDLPVYYDTKTEASSAFGAWSLPTTVVVSADGEILAVQVGMIDPAALRNVLDSLI